MIIVRFSLMLNVPIITSVKLSLESAAVIFYLFPEKHILKPIL